MENIHCSSQPIQACFFTKLKISILGNCIKEGRLSLRYHISIELQSLHHQNYHYDYRYAVQTGASIDWRCVTCQSMSLSEIMPVAENTPVDFTESMFTLHEPLADPAESTPVTESTPIAESTPVDFTASLSALHEPLVDPAADESSILEPLPAPVENADSSFAVTFQILEDCTTKGKPKLIDSRGYSYNVKRRRGNATDWQCTVRPKVTFVKLSLAEFSREG